ncbi:MAG: hypothetical protein ABIN94_12575 [Ferruginibacter sp.]
MTNTLKIRNKKELDVDFIGGQEALTKDEEKAISDFIKSRKVKRERVQLKPKNRANKSRVVANA